MRRYGKISFIWPSPALLRERCFLALLLVLWTYPSLGGYVVQGIKRLPLAGYFHGAAIPALVAVLVIFSVGYIAKNLRPADILFYMAVVLLLLMSMMLMETNAEYIELFLWQILISVVPLYFVGLSVELPKCRKLLWWASLACVLTTCAYQLYVMSRGRALPEENMSTAYKVLPSMLYLVYWAFRQRKLIHGLLVALSGLLVFLFGTRGPVVVFLVYLAVELYLWKIRGLESWKKALFLMSAVFVLFCMSYGSVFENLLGHLKEIFEAHGFSTRVLDYMLDGDFTHGNGREELSDIISPAIWERPFLGYGIMGDRVLTGGRYVHSIALELWCDFGIVFGTILLAVIYGMPLLALLKCRGTDTFHFILLLMCAMLIKLLLSSSFLLEPDLFLLLGVSVKVCRARRMVPDEENDKKSPAPVEIQR
ncbi:MAG: O-antigen ligase family protein [Oscillospiraceae bacterium]|nr:O-antigen ligase family protein [Oscillospiraceae bacterium]MBQ2384007.1 O-antigen ligase family protein [Oscillospiraceae bacterium]MBQ5711165.1 O-antigen ligase family protein [Oscillospiraceae bacterium]